MCPFWPPGSYGSVMTKTNGNCRAIKCEGARKNISHIFRAQLICHKLGNGGGGMCPFCSPDSYGPAMTKANGNCRAIKCEGTRKKYLTHIPGLTDLSQTGGLRRACIMVVEPRNIKGEEILPKLRWSTCLLVCFRLL